MNKFRLHRFKGYSLAHFRKDLIAGIIVGIIAIPLGMAFAIASGVNPEYGIYTTIIAGFLISILGGSKFQIGGPTGAFIPILLGVVLTYGYENLLIAGFLAGVILLIMGIFKLGTLIKFIPRSVTIGFTSGIAVIIFSSQIANFLGLSEVESHVRFTDNMMEIGKHIGATNLYSVLTASLCLALIILIPKVLPKIPATLVGIAGSTAVALLFFSSKVPTIGTTYGAIQQSLPALQIPAISLEKIQFLLIPALMIALLGGIESLLSAVVADGMTNDRHHSNRELMGQGIANMVAPLFGGIPATGAIARTATNIKSGAVSPMSGVIHSVVVLLILLLFAPLASHIPLASMAPVLMVVAWNMSERKRFMYVFKMKSEDTIILIVTFILTVFVDLMTGVGAGILLAFVLFIRNMSETVITRNVLPSKPYDGLNTQIGSAKQSICPQFSIINVEGVLFFGSAQSFEYELMESIKDQPAIVLLRMNKVPFMDITCASYFSGVVQHIQKYGGQVYISEIRSQPKTTMIKSGLYQTIDHTHIFEKTEDAIVEAMKHIEPSKCDNCHHSSSDHCKSFEHVTVREWTSVTE